MPGRPGGARGPGGLGVRDKSDLRRTLLAARRRRESDCGGAAVHLDALLAPIVEAAARRPDGGVVRVASYSSMAGEPSTAEWHLRCAAAGITVLLPKLLASGDLALGTGPLEPGLRGTSAPIGPGVEWSQAVWWLFRPWRCRGRECGSVAAEGAMTVRCRACTGGDDRGAADR